MGLLENALSLRTSDRCHYSALRAGFAGCAMYVTAVTVVWQPPVEWKHLGFLPRCLKIRGIVPEGNTLGVPHQRARWFAMTERFLTAPIFSGSLLILRSPGKNSRSFPSNPGNPDTRAHFPCYNFPPWRHSQAYSFLPASFSAPEWQSPPS